ncbi:MAG: PKD domain-containing protein, partial [Crocinitomicaceae bacterium]|nr:PKD domain-containing protein [Crocinitomicaceae bacterium]
MFGKFQSRRLLLSVIQGAIIVFVTIQATATHIVGGEIYYTWQGANNYLITLKVYRDCGPNNTLNTPFDAEASVGVFTSNGSLFSEVTMLLSNAEVSIVPVILENPCFVLPPDVCVERAVYTKWVQLPQNAGGYDLIYQRCCRNPSIINLNLPQNSGATFRTHIPGTSVINGHNSSAQFVHFPPPALCTNAEFTFDHSATDIDGDSLVYEFCSPLLGGSVSTPAPQPPNEPPYSPVSWASGFSSAYPITSNPAFTIDSHTGLITGTATQMGQYVMGVCVSEYRNGVWINSTNRDFQFNVTLCNPNIIATIPDQSNSCDGLTVFLENESVNASFFFWDFGVEGITTDTSTVEDPHYTYPGSGEYEITLIANPGWPCADTAYTTYTVTPQIDPQIATQGSSCINGTVYHHFSATANVSSAALYHWDFGPGALPATSSIPAPQGVLLNPEVLLQTVVLTVTDDGCEETDTVEIENLPDPIAAIVPQESFCNGLTYSFQSASENATTYYWDFGTVFTGDHSTQQNAEFTFPDTGVYVITHVADAADACPDTTQMEFVIYGLLAPHFETPAPQCLSTNSFDFASSGASTSTTSYHWDFGEQANSHFSESVAPHDIVFSEAGHHSVTLTISENGCTRSTEEIVWVVRDPQLNAQLQREEGCPDLYVNFNAETVADTQVFYDWDFGDGATGHNDQPIHIYSQPGSYDVSVLVYTVNGCVDTLTDVLSNAVTVFPVPDP